MNFVAKELRRIDEFRPDALMARSDPTLSNSISSRLLSLPLVLEPIGRWKSSTNTGDWIPAGCGAWTPGAHVVRPSKGLFLLRND